ncbi:hypothetical protein JXB02_00075 [Candidatus Woesearchaeota archaeon]|nr:hypothetical protein [Candidatus Woesearchaeota archaeon]
MNIKELIDGMDLSHLEKLKFDLESENSLTKQLIEKRMERLRSDGFKVCAVCGQDMRDVPMGFTLIFGPDDFKKQAHFCALDCLEYFQKKLKAMAAGEEENEAQQEHE